MNWLGMFTGLGFALAILGLSIMIGTAVRMKSHTVPNAPGTVGIGGILLVIGSMLIGATW